MNPYGQPNHSTSRAAKSIALIAILSAIVVYQASIISNSNKAPRPILSSVISPLLPRRPTTASPAAAAAPLPATYMPNYAITAIMLRHWTKREVSVHVTPSAADDKTPQEVKEAVTESAAIWNDKVGQTVTLKLTDEADADIDISFVTPGTLTGGAVGLTDVRFNCEDQSIGSAGIRVSEKLPKAQLVQVLAHELGHALGIQGHSDDRDDLMYPFAHLPAQITDRDINTFHMGYGQPANSTATISVE